MTDDILLEVRKAREAYAQQHNFDVRAMVADLQSKDQADSWTVVRREPRPVQLKTANHNENVVETTQLK